MAGPPGTAIYDSLAKTHKILDVEGGWLSSFLFDVSSSDPYYAAALRTISIRVCPAALLAKVRAQALLRVFRHHSERLS